MAVKDIERAIQDAFETPDPRPGQKFEESAKYAAMARAVSLGVSHTKGNKYVSQLASAKVTAAFTLLYTTVIHQLKDSENSFAFNLDKPEVKKNKKTKSLTTPGANAVAQGASAGDYYERLGIPRNADKSTIDKAYREWARTGHPDILRSKGASPEEISAAEETAIQMGEAYNVLKSPTLRPGYDRFWDNRFSSNPQVPTPVEEQNLPQLTSSTEDAGGPFINVATTPSAKPNAQFKNEVRSFQEIVKNQGGSVSPWLTSEMRLSGLLPEGYADSQIIGAVQMYSRGITSEGLLDALEKADGLTEFEKQSVGNMALFVEYMEGAEGIDIPNPSILGAAAGTPSVSIKSGQSPTGISFSRSEDGSLNFVFDKASGFVKDKSGNLIKKEIGQIGPKNVLGKALKEGGKKVLKDGSKVVGKAGAKVAGKTATSAFFESLNGIAPGLGTLLDVLVNWVGPMLLSAAKWILKSFTDPENIAKFLLLFGGVGAVLSSFSGLGLSMLGGGLAIQIRQMGGGSFTNGLGQIGKNVGVVAGLAVSATFSSIGIPIIIAMVIIPLTIATILILMTSGAYVVPPFLPHTGAGRIFEDPYIGVEKTVVSVDVAKCNSPKNTFSHIECLNSDLPVTVEYTVTITAKRGPLTDVTINDSCRVNKNNANPSGCPSPNTTFPFNPPGNNISPTEEYVFNYRRTFENISSYIDSAAYDTVSVSATSAEGTPANVSATASICIGDCPQDCPEGWPVIGTQSRQYYISQGPFTSYTHAGREAIDVHTADGSISGDDVVIATHSGTVASAGVDGWGGLYVDIHGNCNGEPFRSRHVHFSSMDAQLIRGATITKSQILGIIGKTGSAYQPHDHYEFRAYNDGGAGAAQSRPPLQMVEPYVPISVPRSCLGNCGITIP